jgi:XapX domain-containing protein
LKILIGRALSFVIGAGCRYFDIPAAMPPVIPGALIVLAMTLGYPSIDRLMVNRSPRAVATTVFVQGIYRTDGDRGSRFKGLKRLR